MANLLDAVRVVETGVLMTVDCLGRLLGDEGADVVKGRDATTRRLPPQHHDALRARQLRLPPQTKEGKFVLFCGIEPTFWDHFCRAVGRKDLLGDHRRDLVVDFGGGEDGLRLELQRIFQTKSPSEWMQVAVEHDIAMGPAVRSDEIQDDPHLVARGMVVTEHHPQFGDFLTLGNPIVVAGETFRGRSAPAHGEHTDEILAELGYDDATRDDLRAAGVI